MFYNGWTNYATWRVNLEVFDGMDVHEMGWNLHDLHDLAQTMKDYVHEIIEIDVKDGLALDYARAFISDVNWYDIAKHYVEEEPSDEDRGVLEQAAWYDTSAELA